MATYNEDAYNNAVKVLAEQLVAMAKADLDENSGHGEFMDRIDDYQCDAIQHIANEIESLVSDE